MQIILTIFFYIWLVVVACLLYLHAKGAGAQVRRTTALLADSNVKLAEANMKSAQSAHEAAEAALKLAELLEKKHAS